MAQTSPIGRMAVVGAGKMGDTLISALLEANALEAHEIVATAKHSERLDWLAERYGIETTLDNREAVEGADLVLLCVKPQVAAEVLHQIRPVLEGRADGPVILSIVAGLTTTAIEDCLPPGIPVVRAMPNTPSRLGQGMTAVCGGRVARDEHLEMGQDLFSRLGRALILEEKHFDAVTGLSASGPAFIYIILEAMAEGGVKGGLPRRVATELAAQTCLGAAHMVLETGHHPALLKDEVTTPAGCTIDGILKLEEGGLRVTLIKAIVEAQRRARELVDG